MAAACLFCLIFSDTANALTNQQIIVNEVNVVFSSLTFLFLFLPCVLVSYYVTTRNYRNAVLLGFSFLFYLWGSGQFLFILILSMAVDYFIALQIYNSVNDNIRPATRINVFANPKTWVTISIAFNLSLLAYFKYTNFFVTQVNHGLYFLGFSLIGWNSVVLPIGISFFTFHKISYVVDIYRHRRPAMRRFVEYALYVTFFPQLIAGPIIRFYEISDQIKTRRETLNDFYYGVLRFSWGLSKKVLLANSCGEIADNIFSLGGGSLDTKTAWLGAVAYTLQIYLDFSAYSDMAVGLGRMFGFRFPENFNRPYSSITITDFWRRWHISLSRFFRDYVYVSLGGSRVSPARTYVNLITVFLLCGLWHGANWTFIVWGTYHGVLLILERISGYRNMPETAVPGLRRVMTLILVIVGWVFFRAPNIEYAMDFLNIMFIPVNKSLTELGPLSFVLNGRNLFFLLLSIPVFFLPRDFSAMRLWESGQTALTVSFRMVVLMGLVVYSVAMLASGSFNPFIYFQF